uniref:ATPase family AAA domain-containing protein 2 n=1 Tax=Scleropages formosus TaxID=113540 RepID=A0A8C9W5W2_SCLFO
MVYSCFTLLESHEEGEEEDEDVEDDEDDDDGDEVEETGEENDRRYNLRQRKTVQCLPLNLRPEDLASGVLRDRVKVGASLADVDPMTLDTSVRFDSVGGLRNHIQALKEMVVFPLLYPEVFEKFKIQPPRGCLFYGPPGTGKTLVARALANECSQGDRKVSFFMRKGADCLSKWVGESERQLRLLFDQAYLMRPSIIFFDEIDGLAPVRSSRQDQIHSSIVSTLLALMDGLDSRGEIVVIGATNRLDSIDPALRRPGRFDREFLFSLPDRKARKHILDIHTRDWNPKLAEPFVEELAEKCVGYCGADIKALCTEAALVALRRRYPQIYGSSQKFKLDVDSIVLGPQDFQQAMRIIVPASQRALGVPGRALSAVVRPLLEGALSEVLSSLLRVFPHAEASLRDPLDGRDSLVPYVSTGPVHQGSAHQSFLHFTMSAYHQPTSYRPRLLLAGDRGSGQSTHLAPAVLHCLEKFSVHRLDLPTLYSISAKTPEESCAQVFREARRTVPSVVYMPHISEWWEAIGDTVKSTFLTLLQDVPSFTPVLLLATSETTYQQLPEEVKCIFRTRYGEVVNLKRPSKEDRRKFFRDLILVQAARAPARRKKTTQQALEVLLPAEDPGPRQLSPEEQRRLDEQEENTLRELRLFLRDVTRRLATDKRFSIFSKPVDVEEVSDYLEVIRQPMDLSTIMTKIDTHKYLTAKDFLADIDLICSNALEYNPDKDPGDKIIRHRACSLKDTAHARFASELDPEFNRMCEEIKESRRKRGEEDFHNYTNFFSLIMLFVKVFLLVFLSSCNQADHVKRKARRKPSWGRGIIRKKKTEDVGEEYSMAGPSDSCLTQDEDSSCDTMETSHGEPQPNGHVLSTEEESSNEPPVVPAEPRHKQEAMSTSGRLQECMNGDESLDSLDSEANKKSSEGGEEMSTEVEVVSTQSLAEGDKLASTGVAHHHQENKASTPQSSSQQVACEEEQGKEDIIWWVEGLLEHVVERSEGYTVDQLERLYSLLSQCIYQHRRDYDKTQMTEVGCVISLVCESMTEVKAESSAAAVYGSLPDPSVFSQGLCVIT